MSLLRNIGYKLPIWIQYLIHQLIAYKDYVLGDGSEKIANALEKYGNKDKLNNECYRKKIIRDLKRCYIYSLTKPQEYFLFGFEEKDKSERRKYLTDICKDMYCSKYIGHRKFNELMDKYVFYMRMKDFYKRDVMLFNDKTEFNDFRSFITAHPSFIAKPNKGSFGKNTEVYDSNDKSVESIYDKLRESGVEFILEELIVQVPEMAEFNPTSVNSIRIPTFRTSKGIEVFGCFVRTGRKGSVVDNAGVGGIFAKVDDTNGKIISNGFTENGEEFIEHPDSKKTFINFQIPQWEEAISLAKKCHEILPDHKYIGWDFVLTKNGWVLMEGNWGQYLCQQVSSGKPMKQQFLKLLKG